MDLLKQCQQWFEQDEAQKVIDTLEAIPAESVIFSSVFIMIQFPFFVMKRVYQKNIVADRYG